ncbi:Alpha/Beta hydrolase protein [Cyathus striatus]|nr:Alpha/Beta hydrolase protein [Cyathus striatus]
MAVFAWAVYDQNVKLVKAGLTPVNLTSVMIGNGLGDPIDIALSFYDMQRTPATILTVLDIKTCVAQKDILARCEKWMRESCEYKEPFMALSGSSLELTGYGLMVVDLNRFDMSKSCEGDHWKTMYYPETLSIPKYLSDPTVRKTLGVDIASVPLNFSSCNNDEVAVAFGVNQDYFHTSKYHTATLLERGGHVLIYVGANDWLCSHVSNERFMLGLEWSGQRAFGEVEKRVWEVDGKRAGVTKSMGSFTFATIDGAGHMVPYDKPKETLVVLQRWLAGEDL